jgi:hypothetical protein
MKPAPLPNIDLGGTVRIIDDSQGKPVWKTLARVFATKQNAVRVLRKAGYSCGWLFDDLGGREFLSVNTVKQCQV